MPRGRAPSRRLHLDPAPAECGEAALRHALLVADWSADVTLFVNRPLELSGDDRAALAARGVLIEPGAVQGRVGTAPALTGLSSCTTEVSQHIPVEGP